MANTNQGLRQESVRAVTGTTLSYNGDWLALFRLSSIDTGSWNGDMLAWINLQLGVTYTNLSGAMVAYAVSKGFDNWGSMGTFSVSGGYSGAASQFFSRITDPGATRKNAYAAIIDALVSAGVWTKLDALWIVAADIKANALINLKSSSYSLTEVNTPTFTADQGFTNASTSYLDTGFNASTAGGNYTRNSAHLSCWIRAGATQTSSSMGLVVSSNVAIYPFYTDNNLYGRINDITGAGVAIASSIGHSLANRSSAGSEQVYRNATTTNSAATASVALDNEVMHILRGYIGQISAASIGGSLNSTEVTAFYNALNNNKWW